MYRRERTGHQAGSGEAGVGILWRGRQTRRTVR
jgi:hypothetical protein